MRLQDWAFIVSGAGLVAAVLIGLRGQGVSAAAIAAVSVIGGLAVTLRARRNPSPMPYFFRPMLAVTRLGTPHLRRLLQPRAGERFLEVGPGSGHNAVTIAADLLPAGEIEVLDVQQEMLDAVMERARRAGRTNVFATQGDARQLPFADQSFDAAYLSAVVGEIPERHLALAELRRVLKPGGRLAVAEILIDPDYISLKRLKRELSSAGFVFEQVAGSRLAYAALFTKTRAIE